MKIPALYLCLILVLFGHTLRAQAPIISWQTCLGGSLAGEVHAILWEKCLGREGNDQLQSIELTPDGGYILAGSTTSRLGEFASNHGLER